MHALFKSALGTIRVGVEDLKSNDDHRLQSSVRDVYAGLLLLCKEKLRRLSPDDEILLFARYEPQPAKGGGVVIKPQGKNTVDVADIKKRFKDFNIPFEWKRLDAIGQIRNHMEHAHYTGPREAARQAVADAFVVIRAVLVDVLNEDPVAVLGAECWGSLLDNAEFFEVELATCKSTLANIKWETRAALQAIGDFACPECQSFLVRQRDPTNECQRRADLSCFACGKQLELGAVLALSFEETFGGEIFAAAKDGDQLPIETCPECDGETFVVEEGKCATCSYAVPEGACCAICEEPLSAWDYSEHRGLCSYHAHVGDRDD